MSRLDVLIQRMTAQRECLNFLLQRLAQKKGIVVELGLGSGRTYDHLRENLAGYPIYTFDYAIECHPSCQPPAEFAVLGEIGKTLPPFAAAHEGSAFLIHCDIGSKDPVRDEHLYQSLFPHLHRLSRPGTTFASDRPLSFPGLREIPSPAGAGAWPYYLYERIE